MLSFDFMLSNAVPQEVRYTRQGVAKFHELTSELSWPHFQKLVQTVNETKLSDQHQEYIRDRIGKGNMCDAEFIEAPGDIYLLQALLREELTLSEMTTFAVFKGALKDKRDVDNDLWAERVPLFDAQDKINPVAFQILEKNFTTKYEFSQNKKSYSANFYFHNKQIHPLAFFEECRRLSKKERQFLIVNDPILLDPLLDRSSLTFSALFLSYMSLNLINVLGGVHFNKRNLRIVPSFGMIQIALKTLTEGTNTLFNPSPFLQTACLTPKLGLSDPVNMLENAQKEPHERPFAITFSVFDSLLKVKTFATIHRFKGCTLGGVVHDMYHGLLVSLASPHARKASLSLANSLLSVKPNMTYMEKKEHLTSLEKSEKGLFKFINYLIDIEMPQQKTDTNIYFFYYLLYGIVTSYPLDSIPHESSVKKILILFKNPNFLKKHHFDIHCMSKLEELLKKSDSELNKELSTDNIESIRKIFPFVKEFFLSK